MIGIFRIFSKTALPSKPAINHYLCAAQKLQGKVSKVSMAKTVVVTVDRLFEHPIYKKRSIVSKTYLVHDEDRNCSLGDKVELKPCRPLSRHKRFTISRIIRRLHCNRA